MLPVTLLALLVAPPASAGVTTVAAAGEALGSSGPRPRDLVDSGNRVVRD